MKKVVLKVEEMTCSACQTGLEKFLNKQDGIESATVNLIMGSASIKCSDNLTIDDLNKYVSSAGFKSLGEYDTVIKKDNNTKKIGLILNGFIAFLVLYISMSHMINLPVIPFLHMKKYPINYSVTLFLFALYFLIYGRDIIKFGIKNIIYKNPNMDTLVMLGVLTSFLYSSYNTVMIIHGTTSLVENLYFESCCIIIYLIKLGRYIDNISKEKTKDAIKGLVTITPDKAILKTTNGNKTVTLDEVKKGDILVAKPGVKIAVDGVIVEGKSYVNESFISGESTPVKKTVGDSVVAGSINIDGEILYKAQKIGKDSTISEIVRLVIEATGTKPPIAKIADKVSLVFVPCIIGISVLTFICYLILGYGLNSALISFTTVLLVACPCSLGLATPLAVVVSEGICAKNGILVKKSEILENANNINTVVFDKTGTLTYGTLKVSKINNYSNLSKKEILDIIHSLEEKTTHPIATAFKEGKDLNAEKVKIIEGMGVVGDINGKKYYIGNNKLFNKLKIKNQYIADEKKLSSDGCSIIYLIEDTRILALIGVKDIVRNNAKDTIKKLINMKKEVVMLTGDNSLTANIIAKKLGITETISNVLPKEKANVIKKLKNNKKVMMVGDGINDAISLAVANVGVSLNSGTDIAGDSADVILINDNLNSICNLLEISKKTVTNIKQNLFWAFFYNICMIPIAIGILKPIGIEMNPMIAGLAMTLSSLTVVLNALKLKKWSDKKHEKI